MVEEEEIWKSNPELSKIKYSDLEILCGGGSDSDGCSVTILNLVLLIPA